MSRLVVVIVALAGVATLSVVDRSRAAVAPGLYSGLSSQGLPVKLTVAGDGTTLSLSVDWVARCGRGGFGAVERTVRSRATTISDGGAFSWQDALVERYVDADELRLRLRIDGRLGADGTITGTWHGEGDSYNGEEQAVTATCSSGDVTFSVRIGGSTSLPPPRSDAAGNLVTPLAGSPSRLALGGRRPWVLGAAAFVRGTEPQLLLTEIDPGSGQASPELVLDDLELDAWFTASTGAAYLVNSSATVTDAPLAPRVQRVETRTHRVGIGPRRSPFIRRPVYVSALAAGSGAVWLLTRDRILRVAPGSRRIVQAIRVQADPRAKVRPRCRTEASFDRLEAGPRALWVVSTSVYRCAVGGPPHTDVRQQIFYTLSRLNPSTNRVTRTFALRGVPNVLAADSGGAWLTACPLAGCSPDPAATNELLYRAASGARPRLVARLPRGKVVGIAGAGGALWISQRTTGGEREGALRRLDVASGRLSTELELPGEPSNPVAAADAAWVIDTNERTLIRVRR